MVSPTPVSPCQPCPSRRRVARLLLGWLGGALALGRAGRQTRAQPGCRADGHPCEGNQQCCAGLVCRVGEPGNKRQCAGPPTPTPTPGP